MVHFVHSNFHASQSLYSLYIGYVLRWISFLYFSLLTGICGKSTERAFNLEFDKGGNYSVRVTHIGTPSTADSLRLIRKPDVLSRPDMADSHLLFAPLTDYALIYGDSGNIRRDFETQQVLVGKVDNTEGRRSVVVKALNCKTGQIFQTYADKEGQFVLNVNEFVDSTVFNIDAYDKLDKRRKFDVSLNESPVPNIPASAPVTHIDNTTLYTSFDSARVLKNIEVTALNREAMNNFKIEPSKGFFNGDPAIYRHANLSSLLRSMGVYNIDGITILLDNQIIQRSTASAEERFDENIENYLNSSINIHDIWQVEYIRNDPRTMMFQSAQNAKPVLLIFTKFGAGGLRVHSHSPANSFTPMGYEPNVINRTEENDGCLILWKPEIVVRNGELINIPINDDDLKRGVNVSIYGMTDNGELVDCNFVIL